MERDGGADLERAVAVLRAGGLVAFPTETVSGLGADASDPDEVRRIFAAKGRPADHPLIVHLASADELDRWALDVPRVARALAAACWSGPRTIVLRTRPDVPSEVTGGLETVSPTTARHVRERLGDGVPPGRYPHYQGRRDARRGDRRPQPYRLDLRGLQ